MYLKKGYKSISHKTLLENLVNAMNYGTTQTESNIIMNGVEKGMTAVDGTYSTMENNTSANSWLLDSPMEIMMLVSVILNSMAAGIIFIFTNTIMPALATQDPEVGINVMNKINIIIVNPLFVIAFFGGLISVVPTGVMWRNPDTYSASARYYALFSTLIFFLGESVVTVSQNVPRNNALLAVDPTSDDGVNYWRNQFLKEWVAWNTVRCFAAAIAAVLGALSLSFMRKS